MSLEAKIKEKIVKYFAKRRGVAAVYLYGSQARGEAKSDSDIDLAVLTTKRGRKKLSGLDSPQIIFPIDLTKLLGKKVEVQDLRTCRIDFAHRVLAEGKLLVSNNEKERIAFEERVLRQYFDLKPALDEYYKSLSEIAKRGELHVRYT